MRCVIFRLVSLITLWVIVSSTACKTEKKERSRITYDVSPPEILKDPNSSSAPAPSDAATLDLTSATTPCVTQISSQGYAADRTWRESFSRFFMQRICGKDPNVAKNWRSSTQYNPDSWVAGVNLTGITLNVPRGTAITPRHVIYTKHYGYHGQVGQTLNFLTLDNRLISRKIIGVKYLSTEFDPDIAVIQLEYDLPGSITPLKVLHPNAANYVALYSPLLRIDQESKALIV